MNLIVVLNLIVFFSCTQDKNKKIVVACAANLQFAMEEIKNKYDQDKRNNIDLIFGSSGKLTAQIISGAPYDIFISADTSYPLSLWHNKLCFNKPKIFTYGRLVLWTTGLQTKLKIDDLENEIYKKIAVANPKLAPYGKAAIESLKFYGVYDKIKHKLIFGESIGQVNHFISSNKEIIGMTALASVKNNNTMGVWIEIPIQSHDSIAQGMVIVKNGKIVDPQVLDFYNYLSSKTCKKILSDYGYYN